MACSKNLRLAVAYRKNRPGLVDTQTLDTTNVRHVKHRTRTNNRQDKGKTDKQQTGTNTRQRQTLDSDRHWTVTDRGQNKRKRDKHKTDKHH